MENDATFSNFNNDEDTINNNYKTDVFHMWTDKSQDISFKSTTNCIGNGEEKLARELDILKPLGGQNSTIDLIHPHIGNISVKDMTNDDCRLGTECRYHMNIIFAQIVNPFLTWILKYNSKNYKELENYFNEKYKRVPRYRMLKMTEWIEDDLSDDNYNKIKNIMA